MLKNLINIQRMNFATIGLPYLSSGCEKYSRSRIASACKPENASLHLVMKNTGNRKFKLKC